MAVSSLELRMIRFASEILLHYGNSNQSGALFVYSLAKSTENLHAELVSHRFRDGDVFTEQEQCCLCGSTMAFDVHSPEMSLCTGCNMGIERCSVTYQLMVSPDIDVDSKLFQCSVCHSMQNRGIVHALHALICWEMNASAMCPFCSVLMMKL